MKQFAALTPTQATICLGVLVFTLIGALALAVAFRWWNGWVIRRASERR